ncbi:MAG: hypothetical protein LBG60_13575 [Bifidobacteriaceae bacterium]|jgi:hypothetical protein|nr:hypothetical protein [Bifidobacteriaceae bacterium]
MWWSQLMVFLGGFVSPFPLLLLALAVLALLAARAVADGRLAVGLPPSTARLDWDAARHRRAQVNAGSAPDFGG